MLQTISCSLTHVAGMSWLHYSFAKAAPWSPLNWQVGGLNLRLIWKKTCSGNLSLRHNLQFTGHPGLPPVQPDLALPSPFGTSTSETPMGQENTTQDGHLLHKCFCLQCKALLARKGSVWHDQIYKPTTVAFWQHSPGIVLLLYHKFSLHLHRFHYLKYFPNQSSLSVYFPAIN